MSKCEKLKKDFCSALDELLLGYKNNSIALNNEGREDEAILEKIKINVAEIFYEMFKVSYNKTCKNTLSDEEKIRNLYNEYLNFFNKIPASWKVKLQKNKEFNMTEEYYKEKLKLETADKIKNIFLKQYERFE